jgi:hypothetical protein
MSNDKIQMSNQAPMPNFKGPIHMGNQPQALNVKWQNPNVKSKHNSQCQNPNTERNRDP